jgi:LysR family glycine cleavage system transcriptional activator
VPPTSASLPHGARWLLPRIGRFVADNPDIDLDIGATNALADFTRGEADVAIRYGFGHWPGLDAEHLADDAFFPVCSPQIAGGPPKRPEDLANYTLLRAEDEYWKPWFDAVGLDWPEPERGTLFNDSSHLLQAAADGQGVALARRTLIGKDLHNGVLMRPFDVEVPAPRRFYLVYPPRLRDAPKLESFRAWIRRELEADNDASVSSAMRPPVSGARRKR